ncbi:androgen-binding protein homolog [Phodopus roborovskii]|uniref:Scgb2b2 protein n=1 Tax=Phodopus roborovskii TaxID=109678 RepID=A0AAV0A933_PHORO|nr:androgen-binding protein homolog [Phodopus roborovskii]CAH7360742.1 Scgb2b2 [Phodopus roborovskii]
MKGTLLLLALLVTGELGFQTTEACLPFYEAFGSVVVGSKTLLNIILSKFNPTSGEREALEKIQECYNEGGLEAKVLDTTVVQTITLSPECRQHFTEDTLQKIKALLSQITRLLY